MLSTYARLTLPDVQHCYTMRSLKSTNNISYYPKPKSTAYKLIANLLDSTKSTGGNYLIVLGNWDYAPNNNLHLYPLCREILGDHEG
mgnify:CR=1 FL=1